MHVLIIDDDAEARSALGEMLGTLGHSVAAEADTLGKALDAYQKHRPDLVTLDVAMPDADGLTVLDALHALNPQVKVLIISGHSEKVIKDALAKGGASGFMLKPYTITDLRASLDGVAAV